MNLVEITIRAKDEATSALEKNKNLVDKLKNTFGGAAAAIAGGGGASLAGALGIAGVAVGAFGAVAEPELKKVEAAMNKTGKAGQKAWAQLTPAQQALGSTLKNVQTQFGALQEKLAPIVDKVITLAGKTATDLLPALGKLATAGGKVLDAFLKPFDAFIRSASFSTLIDQMSKLAVQVGNLLGPALVKLIQQFIQLFVQVAPAGVQILQALLPAIEQLFQLITPGIVILGKLAASIITWMQNNHLLVPTLIAVSAIAAVLMGASGIGGITLAIVALSAIIGFFATHWRQIWTDIKNWFHDAVNFMKNIWDAMPAWLKRPIEMYIDFWKIEWNIVKDVFKLTISFIRDAWSVIKDILEAPFKAAEVVIMGVIHGIEAAINAVSSAISGVVSFAKGVGHVLGSVGSFLGLASGGIVGAAGGGVHGGLRLVGEHGPELVKLPTGSTVFSNPDTRHMMSQGGSGGQVVISFDFGNGSDELVKILRKAIRVKGGNVQTVLGHG